MNKKSLKPKILITGGTSRFCKYLKKELKKFKTVFPNKKEFNIKNFDSMKLFLKNKKIDIIIHIAGLSRPMKIHDQEPITSIDLNIIGTANVVKISKLHNIKLIYFSTAYVYPGTTGNYKETDSLRPFNNYGWSKLGGECAVKMYENSLILRLSVTDYPFTHSKAIKGAISSFIFNKDAAKIIPLLLDQKGVINLGGKRRDIYKFAKKFNNKIEYVDYKKIKNFAKDSSLNIKKLQNIFHKKKLNKIDIEL